MIEDSMRKCFFFCRWVEYGKQRPSVLPSFSLLSSSPVFLFPLFLFHSLQHRLSPSPSLEELIEIIITIKIKVIIINIIFTTISLIIHFNNLFKACVRIISAKQALIKSYLSSLQWFRQCAGTCGSHIF